MPPSTETNGAACTSIGSLGTWLSIGAVATVGSSLALAFYYNGKMKKTQSLLDKELTSRQQERQGRIRAEQKVRDVEQKLLLLEQSGAVSEKSEVGPYPFLPIKPIGFLKSVYKTRNGCPRQPYYVNKGRAILKLLPHCNPSSSMDGLGEYSHCYIIFQFNLNTNLTKESIPAKISPPRLENKKVGLYATRTPHRYNAIGLSIVEINHVDKKTGTLYLKGTDLVDGTAILDVKPYIDTYDNFANVRVPDWIKDPIENVERYSVEITDAAMQQLNRNVKRLEFFDKKTELNEFIEFLQQVLSQDIRSHSKKVKNQETQDTHELLVDNVKVLFTIDPFKKVNTVMAIENANTSTSQL